VSDFFDIYAQQRTDAGWIVPPSMSVRPGEWHGKCGHLFEFKVGSAPLERLFLGKSALLPLKDDLPPDFKDTELFIERLLGFEECFVGWAPMGDLLVDEWSESLLYISRAVPGHLAHHFSDGAQPFPMQALSDAGCSSMELDRLEDTTSARDIRSQGRGGDAIEVIEYPIVQRTRGTDLPRAIQVSWTLSITKFIGEWQTAAIQSVRDAADDTDLRIICLFGG
jgi:hypothetical protein